MKYYQCELSQGSTRTTGWIEARGAKVGSEVELRDDWGWWTVTKVFTPPIESNDLKAKQERDRNCFASLARV